MAKRKRRDSEEEPVDVGLGATLAHLRGEDDARDAPAAPRDDDEGWTVVGPKRRRKERDADHDRMAMTPAP
jgi:RNA exonuclease 1